MKKGYLCAVLIGFFSVACANGEKNTAITLKEALSDKFKIGVALNKDQFTGADSKAVDVIKQHFNSVVAENCMKSEELQPKEGEFFFDDADKFIAFGEANNMNIIGHTLIWHSQAPDWFFVDEQGNDVSREVLIERMKNHIYTVAGRYKGKVNGWDVVNEAVLDDGSLRNSKFLQIIGEDYLKLAFQFANKADPNAELYYNDYSMANEGRREGVVKLVKSLREQGVRIDGIGMQGHLSMDYPPVEEFEKSIIAFAELGVKVMITELDLTILPSPKPNVGADIANTFEYKQEMNPYVNGLPEDIEIAWEKHYNDFFKLFLKHADKIDRVTLWGVADINSWKNDWPIEGRTDYPLLFDRNYQPKQLVNLIINESQNNSQNDIIVTNVK